MPLFVHIYRRQVLSTIAHIMSTPIAATRSMWGALTLKLIPNEDGVGLSCLAAWLHVMSISSLSSDKKPPSGDLRQYKPLVANVIFIEQPGYVTVYGRQ